MDAAVLPRGTRWAARRQYASLLVGLGLAVLHLVLWPILFLLQFRYHFSVYGRVFLELAITLWFLLPLGAVYGLYLASARPAAPGAGLRRAGFAANAAYLLFGILLWIAACPAGSSPGVVRPPAGRVDVPVRHQPLSQELQSQSDDAKGAFPDECERRSECEGVGLTRTVTITFWSEQCLKQSLFSLS